MIENWKAMVGFQPNIRDPNADGQLGTVYYVKVSDTPEVGIAVTIEKTTVECNLTEEEMCKQLDEILTSFPKSEFKLTDNEKANDIIKKRAGNIVARNSRRGFAGVEYKNSLYYRGSYSTDASRFDCAVYVAELDGKFGIVKHPKFDKYGFTFDMEKK